MNRSNTCKCDVCSTTDILVSHHINGRKIVRPNHVSNITNVCCNCHRKIHEGIIILEGWFNTTDGLKLLWFLNDDKNKSFSGKEIQTYVIP